VGAIKIGSDESSFDVAERMAGRFEQVVRGPDSRDPHLRIVRVGGAADEERPKRPGKFPRKKFEKKGPTKNRKV
jgi:chromosome condensin MukBEF MukE localization factor